MYLGLCLSSFTGWCLKRQVKTSALLLTWQLIPAFFLSFRWILGHNEPAGSFPAATRSSGFRFRPELVVAGHDRHPDGFGGHPEDHVDRFVGCSSKGHFEMELERVPDPARRPGPEDSSN